MSEFRFVCGLKGRVPRQSVIEKKHFSSVFLALFGVVCLPATKNKPPTIYCNSLKTFFRLCTNTKGRICEVCVSHFWEGLIKKQNQGTTYCMEKKTPKKIVFFQKQFSVRCHFFVDGVVVPRVKKTKKNTFFTFLSLYIFQPLFVFLVFTFNFKIVATKPSEKFRNNSTKNLKKKRKPSAPAAAPPSPPSPPQGRRAPREAGTPDASLLGVGGEVFEV